MVRVFRLYSYNWVVCEQLPGNQKRKFEDIDEEDSVEAKVLRKAGALKIDSCCELLVGKRYGGSMLGKINCFIV